MISPAFPSIWMVPLSNSCTPVRTLISVDFPAPFSPINAWISPFRKVKSTWERARTPVKFLLISRISSTTFCSIFFPPAFPKNCFSAKMLYSLHFGLILSIKGAWSTDPGFPNYVPRSGFIFCYSAFTKAPAYVKILFQAFINMHVRQ